MAEDGEAEERKEASSHLRDAIGLSVSKTQLSLSTAEKFLRHAFSFPAHIREAVRAHVRRAVDGLSSSRFAQEPAYTAALLARLEGTPYNDEDGSVVITSTNVNSVGPGAAERWSGADFAITATITKGDLSIRKAILGWPARKFVPARLLV